VDKRQAIASPFNIIPRKGFIPDKKLKLNARYSPIKIDKIEMSIVLFI